MLLWFKKHFQLTRDIPKNLFMLEDQCDQPNADTDIVQLEPRMNTKIALNHHHQLSLLTLSLWDGEPKTKIRLPGQAQ